MNKNLEKQGISGVTAVTGESDPTQYSVFMAPCDKYTPPPHLAKRGFNPFIKTTGADDPHMRWVKQPGGFYKNVQYGMCVRWPKNNAGAMGNKAMHLGIGT